MAHLYKYKLSYFAIVIVVVELSIALLSILYLGFYDDILAFIGVDKDEFRFEHSYLLWAMLGLPFISLIYIYFQYWRNKALDKYAKPDLLSFISVPISPTKGILKYALVRVAFVFLLLALANPQYGTEKKEAKVSGIDIIIALDVSKSMNAIDQGQKSDRLALAKLSIERLLNKLKGDRIGLIVFAGEAVVQLPLTNDYYAAKSFLKILDTDVVPTPGTSISSAIELAIESFPKNEAVQKAMIVITDGEDHEEGVIEATKKAQKNGLIINTVGLGSLRGVPIPNFNKSGVKVGYKTDNDGKTVVSKLNESMLMEIAEVGQGVYVKAEGKQLGLSYLHNSLNKITKSELDVMIYEDYEDRYQFVLSIGLLLLLINTFITDKENSLFKKLRLFD